MDQTRSMISHLALLRAGALGPVKMAALAAAIAAAPLLQPFDAPGFEAMARELANPDDEGEDNGEDEDDEDDEGEDAAEDEDIDEPEDEDVSEDEDEAEDEDAGEDEEEVEDEDASEDEDADEGEDEAEDGDDSEDESEDEDDAGTEGAESEEDGEDEGDEESEGGSSEGSGDDDDAESEASDDDDDSDDDERDEDERSFASAAGLDADAFDFDIEGFPARSNEVLAFDLSDDDLAIARDLGFEVIERRPLMSLGGSIDRLRAPSAYSLNGAVDALEDSLPAAPFDFNHIYLLPDEPVHADGTAVTPIGQPRSGAGLKVGVIDTLVDTNHPSLRDQSVTVRDFAERGGRDLGHGTAVTSILVGSDAQAEYSGLLPGAEVFAANVFTVNRNGRPATDTMAMVEALDWLAGQSVGVISISVAGPDSAIFAEAVSRAQAGGQIVVAAVGNDGPAAPPLFPATYDGVIGVTAIDLDRRVFRRAGRGAHVDFSAPGVRVRTANANGGYSVVSGTSFATPVVSALIALRVESGGQVTESDVNQLNRSALDLGAPGKDDVFGYGLLMIEEDS